jgi:hypothetical protein
MKSTCIAFLLLIICSSCRSGNSSGPYHRWTFENTTLLHATERMKMRVSRSRGGRYSSFGLRIRVLNDRNFRYLEFDEMRSSSDLLRQIKAKINCEIHREGKSVLIVLPEVE